MQLHIIGCMMVINQGITYLGKKFGVCQNEIVIKNGLKSVLNYKKIFTYVSSVHK